VIALLQCARKWPERIENGKVGSWERIAGKKANNHYITGSDDRARNAKLWAGPEACPTPL